MTSDELAILLRDDVADALAIADPAQRAEALATIGRDAFMFAADDLGGGVTMTETTTYIASLGDAISLTEPDGSPEQAERVTSMLAVSASNAAIVASAPEGAQIEWVTREDDRVRELHVPMHGEIRAVGDPFIVGGVSMLYPGQPVGPPEVWINCRCVPRLHVGVAAAVDEGPELEARLEALSAASDKPWSQFSAGDYTIAQWRRACLLKMPGGDPESKSTYKLPVREPGGALNRNGVHAAAAALAGARGGVNAPAEAKAAAKRKLRGLYRELGEEPPDSLAAATEEVTAARGVSPPGTHDAPGWITHPRETQRLRNYWTRGAGAAKIRWGTPGDLTRCERHLRKYVGPMFSWGTCQNLHHAAMGFFNPESRGRRGGGDPDEIIDMIDAAFTAAADLEETMDLKPPAEWFADPHLDGPTALKVSREGRVLGHLATWDTCHVGISGDCVTPPRSTTNYAHFRTGEVETRDGTLVAVGQITMDTGHAPRDDGANAAASHYDDTGTGVADVVVGEDEFGIWVAGAMRPGVSEQQMYVLKATGALSGDWRRIGGNLELVAALAVNVPGFPVPRTELLVAAGMNLSLVAAAVVLPDPNAIDPDVVAVRVVAALDAREADRVRRARAGALMATINAERVRVLEAAVH